MALTRLGRKLEDGIAAYISAHKYSQLSGLTISTPKQAGALDCPYLIAYSNGSTPYSDEDRRGSLRGPMRTNFRIMIAEHMTGTAIDQWAGELVDILTQPLRIGNVVANTTNSTSMALSYVGVEDPSPQTGDILRIAGNDYTIATASLTPLPVFGQYDITLTAPATLTAGAIVFRQTPDTTADFDDLKHYLNQLGTIGVFRIAGISETIGAANDLRTFEIELEIDAVNTPSVI